MRYVVVWPERVTDDLMSIWTLAPDPSAVAASADRIDYHLTFAPLSFGESRESSLRRVAHLAPLTVEYEVIEDDKRVVVRSVFLVE